MSQVIDTAFAIDDTHNDASTMLDNTTVPLGELVDAHIAKAKEIEIELDENDDSPSTPCTPTRTKFFDVPVGYTLPGEFTRELMAYDTRNGIEGFMDIMKEKAMNQMMKYDSKFATSIFITDEDYEFSVDPDLITLVESDPFHVYLLFLDGLHLLME
jgi:hypothetical protein